MIFSAFSPRRGVLPRTAVVLFSLSGVAALALPAVLTPAPAVAAVQTEKQKRMIDAVIPAILKLEEAETRFGEKKWADCLAAIDAATMMFENAYKRFPEAENEVTLEIKQDNFPMARKYGFVIPERAGFAIQRYGITDNVVVVPTAGGRIRATELQALCKSMRPIALAFSGKAVPHNNDGVSQPNELDAKDFYEKAFMQIARMEFPVPDDQWEGVVLTLNRCVLILDAARAADPAVEQKEYGDGRGSQARGDEVRRRVLAKLAEAEKEYKPAAGRVAAEAPASVTSDLDRVVGNMTVIGERVNSGGYYDPDDADVVGGSNRAAYFANLTKNYTEQYAKEAKPLPADVLKPLKDKIAEVNAALLRKAPGYTFETKAPAPAGIAAAVKAEVRAKYPGATVARVGLDDTSWAIFRTDLGIITGRTRHGRVLYKMPGEKWHRSHLFTYIEDSEGGSRYIAPGRARLGNLLRFESGK